LLCVVLEEVASMNIFGGLAAENRKLITFLSDWAMVTVIRS
jgi:hypothetical protein